MRVGITEKQTDAGCGVGSMTSWIGEAWAGAATLATSVKAAEAAAPARRERVLFTIG